VYVTCLLSKLANRFLRELFHLLTSPYYSCTPAVLIDRSMESTAMLTFNVVG